MLEFIALEQALELILARTNPVDTEIIPLEQGLGRVLGEDVWASLDIPPFDRSPLDGFALRGEDLRGDCPVTLKIVGEVPAGYAFEGEITPGTAVKILTGSPLPTGANAVVRQEDTQEQPGYVRIYKGVEPGSNISRHGEDITAGERLSIAGTEITPALLGVLASQGMQKVKVYVKPQIGIGASGDELRTVGVKLGPGQIYNSNFYTLSAMVQQWGGQPVALGLSLDKAHQLGNVIRAGLEQTNLVVTTGGASVGEYDVTLQALEQAGVTPLFRRVAVKPGTPVLCGEKQGKVVIGLSGNPAAAMISAALILGPAVRKLAGYSSYYPKKVQVISGASFSRKSGVTRLIRAAVKAEDTRLVARFPNQQQPGVLKSMLNSNALVVVPAGCNLNQADQCTAYLLDEWE